VLFLLSQSGKIAIKTDRLRWLKSIDDNLRIKPKYFWKYVPKKNDHVATLKNWWKCNNLSSTYFWNLCGSFLFEFNSPTYIVISNNACFTFSDFQTFLQFLTLTLSMQFDFPSRRSASVQMKSPVLSLKFAQRFLLILVCYEGSFPLCGSNRPSCLFSRKATVL
jgi:hypothetical protein